MSIKYNIMNFANVTRLVIPQGEVIQIQDNLSRILWKKTPTSIPPYFYIEDISGQSNTITIKKLYSSTAPTITVEKSTDGVNWTSMGTSSTSGRSATIPANGKLYLRCNATTWSAANQPNCIESSGNVKVGGNIMSLLYGSNFTGNETTFPSGSAYTFQALFALCKVVNAYDLVLPATTLVTACYKRMFSGRTMLTDAPSQLPALNLATYCYQQMFQGCTSLNDPTYNFLPATTLATYCYDYMFQGCTSLTTAPELQATTLVGYCYNYMFDGCSSLNSVVMMAIEWDMANTTMWLNGVDSLGTFGINPNAEYGEEVIGDPSGIPDGWEIVPVE